MITTLAYYDTALIVATNVFIRLNLKSSSPSDACEC
jgi:hypothetical protein